jgi:hypothetical protein
MFLLVRTEVFDSSQKKNKNLFTVFLLEGRKNIVKSVRLPKVTSLCFAKKNLNYCVSSLFHEKTEISNIDIKNFTEN